MIRFCMLTFLFLAQVVPLYCFEKVVIWGHKLHSHTHSYIHEGFYNGFKRLGYPVYWFDDNDDVSRFNFANCLFITETQVNNSIPLRNDCVYLLHNERSDKFRNLPHANLCVYIKKVKSNPAVIEVEPCIYYDLEGKSLYMPWATDLFPEEIDAIKANLPKVVRGKSIYWVGTLGRGLYGNYSEIAPFQSACQSSGFKFVHNDVWINPLSKEQHIRLISMSYLAPTIVGEWQKKEGYIPCRIFKNISYGQMGITNSRDVYDLFEGKIVYNSDTRQLFFDASERLKTWTLKDMYEIMDMVKERHTYINRCQTVLNFLEAVGLQ